MIKKLFFLILIIFIVVTFDFYSTSAQEELSVQLSSREVRDSAIYLALNQNQEKQTSKLNSEPDYDIPEWVKRTNLAIEVGSDQEPKYFLETIQPLLGTQYKDVVFFNQSRISARDRRPIYNIGFGARKIFKENYLLGINTFYDYQDLYKHSRGGVGVELFSDKGLEARLNTYLRISNEHLVKDDGTNEFYEKVANGFDGELGLPLPYLPHLKLYGGGYWYNFEHFKNKYGWKGRLEFTPFKYSRINFEMFDDTKRNDIGYRFEGAFSLAFTSFSFADIIKDLKGAREAYPKINLQDRVLDRVVRDFDITVINKIKSKTGITVEGGRG